MIPMQTNLSTAYYNPVYIQTDNRSDTDKCLDAPELQDIHNKQLKGENLNDEDVDRVNTCVAGRRENTKIAWILLAIFVLVMVVVIVFCIIL